MKIHWGNPQIQPSPSPSKRRLLSVKACCATFSAAVGEPRSSSTCDRRSNVWTSFSLEPMLGHLFSHHRLYHFYIYIYIYIIQLSITQIIWWISGWWYTYPFEKYEFVSWDDDIPKIWKSSKCSKPPIRNILCVYIYCMSYGYQIMVKFHGI